MAGCSATLAAVSDANRISDGASGRSGDEDWAHAAVVARRSSREERKRRKVIRSK
jgi:hypothetical protein